MKIDFPSSFRLLADLCAMHRDLIPIDEQLRGGIAERVREAGPGLADEAIQHKIAGLVLRQLRGCGADMPPELINKLKQKVFNDSAARMLILKQWRTLNRVFKENGIPVLTIKGPAASIQLYGSPDEREYNDLDLLIDAADLNAAVPIMTEAGYIIDAERELPRIPERFKFLYAGTHHAAFTHSTLPVKVEIHNHTFKRDRDFFPVTTADLFKRAVALDYSGDSFLTLSRADHALYQISHGTCHGWCLLHWLMDAAVILTSDDDSLNSEIAGRAEELDMEPMFSTACLLAEKVFNVNPSPPFSRIRDRYRDKVLSSVNFCAQRLAVGGRDFGSTKITLGIVYSHFRVILKSRRARLNQFIHFFLIGPGEIRALPLFLKIPFLFPLLLLARPFLIIYRRIRRRAEKYFNEKQR